MPYSVSGRDEVIVISSDDEPEPNLARPERSTRRRRYVATAASRLRNANRFTRAPRTPLPYVPSILEPVASNFPHPRNGLVPIRGRRLVTRPTLVRIPSTTFYLRQERIRSLDGVPAFALGNSISESAQMHNLNNSSSCMPPRNGCPSPTAPRNESPSPTAPRNENPSPTPPRQISLSPPNGSPIASPLPNETAGVTPPRNSPSPPFPFDLSSSPNEVDLEDLIKSITSPGMINMDQNENVLKK